VKRMWRGRPLRGKEMVRATRASKINLNILRTQNKNACNMRSFEIPCCGGFMVHERSEDLSGLLKPGSEYEDFGSPQELVEKIKQYLQLEHRRKEIAARGHQAVLKRHTYRSWAERVIDIWRSSKPSENPTRL